MKNIIYSILVCLPFVFGACDKSTDDTSKVTYFVTLEREGDEKIVLEKGQPFEKIIHSWKQFMKRSFWKKDSLMWNRDIMRK